MPVAIYWFDADPQGEGQFAQSPYEQYRTDARWPDGKQGTTILIQGRPWEIVGLTQVHQPPKGAIGVSVRKAALK